MEDANPSGEANGQQEFWTLSGTNPFFSVIIAKSHLNPNYQLVRQCYTMHITSYNLVSVICSEDEVSQKLPAKIQPVLPSLAVPAVLAYRGKQWSMMYDGIRKRFDTNWRKFAVDNGLKIGDACVFELEECSGSKLVFRVQILDGEIPPELAQKIPGATANYPINIM